MGYFVPKYAKGLSLFLLFFCSFVLSQDQEFIEGKLLDAKTQEPIAFASIRIKDKALGIISNTDGSFKIPLRYKEFGEIIEISSMGYQSTEVLIANLLVNDINSILLQPKAFELEEAVVIAKKKRQKKLPAQKIVQNAIDRILDNYPVSSYSQVGYYRDYQLDKGEYVNLNEAILEVFDKGFKTIDEVSTKVVLYEYKKNTDFRRNDFAEKPYDFDKGTKIIDKGYLPSYGGNEFTILNAHNAIRNYAINTYSYVNYFEIDFLKAHDFWKEDNTYIDDKILYSIKFKKKEQNHSVYGTILIAKDDYSIYKFSYTLYDDYKKNSTGLVDKNGISKQVIFEINTEYKKENGKMFLNYISFHNSFRLMEPPKLVMQDVELDIKNKSFILTFNNELNTITAQNIRNFKVTFEGEKLNIYTTTILKNKVILYPKLDKERFKSLFDKIVAETHEVALSETPLAIDVKNVEDIYGNEVNESTFNYFNQYREFFVQQIKLNTSATLGNKFFMNKLKPIFKNQPLKKPDNFSDYWMNTPLIKNY